MNEAKANSLSRAERLEIKMRQQGDRRSKHQMRAVKVGFGAGFVVFLWGMIATGPIFSCIAGFFAGWLAKGTYNTLAPSPGLSCHFCKSAIKPDTKVCPSCQMDIEDMVPEV